MNRFTYEADTLDTATYAALRQSVGWTGFPSAHTEAALRRSLRTLTVRADGEAVAMGRLTGDGLYCLLCDIVVAPSWQGRGIGSEVVRRLLDYALEQTPPGGRTSVQLIAEPGKEGFYTRLGFRTLPHAWCGSGMRKVLHREAEPTAPGTVLPGEFPAVHA